jgi:tetratricopeptide (TPR) repeat protein
MSQRLTRKDIKRDEFANVVGRSVEYAESHSRGLLIGMVSLVVAIAAGSAAFWFLEHRGGQAESALSRAMKVYQAPIDAASPKPDDPNTPSFPNEAVRRAKALKLLTAVRSDYPHSNAADVAGLYLGEIAAQQGRLDEARQRWTDFVSKHDREMLAAQARIDLIELNRAQGKGQQVAQDLRAMLEQSESPLPQDVVLFELAKTLESLHREPEAIQSYQRILDEYPQSSYRQEAQQRVGALDPSRATGAMGGLGMPRPGFPG